jgi:hypothetical protein
MITAKFPPYHDPVNSPKHYTAHPSGVECIKITEHMSFTLGNAIKYIWRADLKNGIEDLQKAKWYIEREIAKRDNQEWHSVGTEAMPLKPETEALLDRQDAQEVE